MPDGAIVAKEVTVKPLTGDLLVGTAHPFPGLRRVNSGINKGGPFLTPPRLGAIVLLVNAISLCLPTADAANRKYTNEEYIEMAGEIVRVRMVPPSDYHGLYTFEVLEVLLGESHPVGSEFQLPDKYGGDLYLSNLRHWPDSLIAFFWKDWETREYPVIRMLGEPARIAAIKKLIAPLAISDELERLEAVFALSTAGPSDDALSMAFLSEMKKMRNPDNYPRVLEMVEQAHPKLQSWALEPIGGIGDLRAVPLLIRFLNSDDQNVRIRAAWILTRDFPGALGVTQAMRDHLSDPDIAYFAAVYLNRREPSNELAAIIERRDPEQSPNGPWSRERRAALERGDKETLRRLCIPLIESPSSKPMYRCTAFLDVFPHLSDSERLNMQEMLIPIIEPVLFTAPDLGKIRGTKAKFLAASDDPRAHELLIQLLLRDESNTRYDRVVAIMALRDGSPELRARASDLILQEFDREAGVNVRGSVSRNLTWLGELLISLAWLGQGVVVEERLTGPEHPFFSKTIEPMLLIEPFEIGLSEETLVLQRLEQALEDISYRDWNYKRQWLDRLIYRVGQLRSEKAVPILLDYLDVESHFRPYIEDALLSIGNDEVIDGVRSQLRAAGDDRRKYRNAELLWELTGSQMLPTLRELAVEDGAQTQLWAWQKLGEVGTPQDLELLRPYRDYWRDDRSVGGGLAWPMATIRNRHNYDLNGPIVP